jgi:hypothetical protein
MLNITELLSQVLDVSKEFICVNISTEIMDYNLCFIEYEDSEKLGVYVTHEDGRERYMILNKQYIVSLQVVYENDIKIGVKDEEDIMVG